MNFRSVIRSLVRPQYIVVLVYVVMIIASWRRWTTLIVDSGREMDLPHRLLNGEMLYRDVHYLYTPFTPYFNAFLYRIFGVHLDTLIASGIVFSTLLVFLCYRIFRRLAPPMETAIATSFVVVLCVFKPSGNLIFPYSFAALHGAVFCLATVLFTIRYAESRKRIELIIAGIFIGLATITKNEFAFAAALTVTVYLIFLHRKEIRAFAADLAYAAVPALLIAVPVFAILFANIDWQILVNDCHLFYTNIPESVVLYNNFRSGFDHPLASLFQMAGAAALGSAFVVLIVFCSDVTGTLRKKSVCVFVISAGIATAILSLSIKQWDGSPLRALPFFLIGMILIEWRRKTANGALFVLAVYSLAILFRVILRVPSGGFSGGFYLPTSIALIFYALLWELPLAVKSWTTDERSFIRARRITQSICVVTILATAFSFGFRYRKRFSYEIAAPRGTTVVENDTGPVIDATLKFIEANTAVDETIAVLPEGNDLAFLTGRRIDLRYETLDPGFLSQQGELDAIAALKRDNVRYIFILNRPMTEFGATAFGRDFYQSFGNWIEENYEVVEVFGVPTGQRPEIGEGPFFIKVYKRKGL
ncbi:MAG: glycosyltransferase family 39 protein [Acidobacteriota bacterium]